MYIFINFQVWIFIMYFYSHICITVKIKKQEENVNEYDTLKAKDERNKHAIRHFDDRQKKIANAGFCSTKQLSWTGRWISFVEKYQTWVEMMRILSKILNVLFFVSGTYSYWYLLKIKIKVEFVSLQQTKFWLRY